LKEEIKKNLDPITLLYSDNVETGYGKTSWKATNTFVWGFEQYGLFIKENEGYAEAIWIIMTNYFHTTNVKLFVWVKMSCYFL
jgi:hypothetical protein